MNYKNLSMIFSTALISSVGFAQYIEPSESEILDNLNSIPKNAYRAQPEGALTGASIFLSPGHGWLWNDDRERWVTQRGVVNNIIEDHSNAESVLQYVVPYLWNAGARVYTTRERDFQTNEVIIEAKKGSTEYREVGDWKLEEGLSGVLNRDMVSIPTQKNSTTAAAVFTPNIPEDGFYGVTIRYRPSILGQSTEEAQFVVNHTGGQTVWTQDINKDGYTWKYIGRYYFEAGQSFEYGSVSVINESDESGRITIDAVRFGGGMGSYLAPDGLPSGKPRWEESGMYYARFLGYDPDISSKRWNSVWSMPIWAEWEMEEWEKDKSVWVSWHGNASSGTARGLFGFVYGTSEWSGVENFTGYPGAVELLTSMLDRIGGNVHADYDPEWRIGNPVSWYLGETNPRANSKMPMALIEVGFFDNVEDAVYMLDPQFRKLTARSTMQGLVDYYDEEVKGFSIDEYLPEPPTHFSVTRDDRGRMELQWQEPPSNEDDPTLGDEADRYMIYQSPNGYGFDNGTQVRDENISMPKEPNGEVTYFKISATNKGGESLPTEVLAFKEGEADKTVLIVYAFDRLDSGMNLVQENGAHRGILSKMNTYDYIVQHAEAIEPTGWGIVSASDEAVASGQVNINDYRSVILILGQEKELDQSFQDKITNYKANGGRMLISGSEAAFAMSQDSASTNWLNDVLGVSGTSDDSEITSVSAVDGEIFEGIGTLSLNDGTEYGYPVKAPDVLSLIGDGQVLMTYEGSSKVAAVMTDPESPTIIMGFPFESIIDEIQRERVMTRILYLLDKE